MSLFLFGCSEEENTEKSNNEEQVIYLTWVSTLSQPQKDSDLKGKEEYLKNIDTYLAFYYKNPKPETLTEELEKWIKYGIFNWNTRYPIIHFFKTAYNENKKYINDDLIDLYKRLKIYNEKMYVLTILRESNSLESKKIAEKLISTTTWNERKEIERIFYTMTPDQCKVKFCLSNTNPAILDILRSSFFASWKEKYVFDIIGYLDSEDILLQSASELSLGANAKEHEIVKKALESEAKSNKNLKLKIEKILWK